MFGRADIPDRKLLMHLSPNFNFHPFLPMAPEISNFAITFKPHPFMSPKLLYLIVIPAFLFSCGSREKESLQSQVDSLKIELDKSHETSAKLAEIGTLLDSIDATRQVLRVNLVEGTRYDDFSGRMHELNNYIRDTEEKINDLEKSLRSSKANASAFSKTIKQLRGELQAKGREMQFLQDEVEKFRNENANLIITVDLQDAEIADKQSQIDAKSQELALIEARVQELMIQSKIGEAEAYYTRAQAIETAAARTKLAPRKKRETIKEALELYRKALSLGKNEAQAKITELEGRL